MIDSFLRLPGGIGDVIYFSFNDTVKNNRAKQILRIQRVPDARVLSESDVTNAAELDSCLSASVDLIAQAKGWTYNQALEILQANYDSFYRQD